jgi:hypothetical protein
MDYAFQYASKSHNFFTQPVHDCVDLSRDLRNRSYFFGAASINPVVFISGRCSTRMLKGNNCYIESATADRKCTENLHYHSLFLRKTETSSDKISCSSIDIVDS